MAAVLAPLLRRPRHTDPARRRARALRPDLEDVHVLSYIDDEPYRREIKGMRNLQEGRHDLARTMFLDHAIEQLRADGYPVLDTVVGGRAPRL